MSESTDPQLVDAAQVIAQARKQRQAVDPISRTHGIATIEDAYTIAQINNLARIAAGARVSGKKVGLTSKVVQEQLGVDQPDFGVLFADMEYLNGQTIDISRLIQPKVEAEVAFILGRDVDQAKPTWAEFLLSLEYAVASIEVVDSVVKNWEITIFDTVSDNAASALYVLGDQPVAIDALSLADIGMQMRINGSVVSTGTGASCLGHPLRSAYWLACLMADNNQPLRRGEVILSGSLGPMMPVQSGDIVDVHMGALGQVSCQFS
ncbi:2-keto-4-pentenoate hydratase [Orrella sp. 11846]|uniref:2-keto-4-pentenoate hydratase n=1 Tax=Orrella sp. 11846 TaxID=3409913 RepID=UPI003B599B52